MVRKKQPKQGKDDTKVKVNTQSVIHPYIFTLIVKRCRDG